MKYLIIALPLLMVHCAQIQKEDDDDLAALAAAELNKVPLYTQEISPAPGNPPPPPSPFLVLGENVLINGSFETPVLAEPWSALPNAEVPGWHGSWLDTTCTGTVKIELQNKNLFAVDADQNQYTELDAHGACTADARLKLAQTFYTVPHHIYRLSFWMRGRDAEHAMGVKVAVGERVNLDLTPAADSWQIVTLHFEATEQATTLSFTETGDGDTYGTFIDAVEVREVTVDGEKLRPPKPGKRPGGKKGQSFEGGRRHKDCHR